MLDGDGVTVVVVDAAVVVVGRAVVDVSVAVCGVFNAVNTQNERSSTQ